MHVSSDIHEYICVYHRCTWYIVNIQEKKTKTRQNKTRPNTFRQQVVQHSLCSGIYPTKRAHTHKKYERAQVLKTTTTTACKLIEDARKSPKKDFNKLLISPKKERTFVSPPFFFLSSTELSGQNVERAMSHD